MYDEDGNSLQTILSEGVINLSYDSLNRLVSADNTSYVYDDNNLRVGVIEGGKETRFTVNPLAYHSQLLIETDESGNPLKYYVYGLGLIAEESQEGYKTYHYDYRGSTIALTDSNGEILNTFKYSPYGELESTDTDSNIRFLYNGRDGVQTDSNGLYYMRARYYNPEIKRFVNQDILLGNIIDSTSLNRYSYVNGNPISYIDPSGLAGILSIYAHHDHSWVSYYDYEAETFTTYGTWNQKTAKGVKEGLEVGLVDIKGSYSGHVSLSTEISDEQENSIKQYIDTRQSLEINKQWTFKENCAYFANGVWEAAGLEGFDTKGWYFAYGWIPTYMNNPNNIAEQIKNNPSHDVDTLMNHYNNAGFKIMK